MTNSQGHPVRIWLRPIAVWVALVLLGLASLGSAYLPLGAFNTPLKLAIAVVMVILLWLFLMDLMGADTLLRLIAIAGMLWLSFMFALTFTDYLSRSCEARGGKPHAMCGVEKVDQGTF
jgi:cytochrome c oxidase subunit IV